MVSEPGFMEALESLVKSSNKKIMRAARGAQWKISGEENHQKQREDDHTKKGKHFNIFRFLRKLTDFRLHELSDFIESKTNTNRKQIPIFFSN